MDKDVDLEVDMDMDMDMDIDVDMVTDLQGGSDISGTFLKRC